MQFWLIIFHRQHILATPVLDLFGDLFLTTHRVDRDDCALNVDLVD